MQTAKFSFINENNIHLQVNYNCANHQQTFTIENSRERQLKMPKLKKKYKTHK